MALTRSSAQDRVNQQFQSPRLFGLKTRRREFTLLLAVSVVVVFGLLITYWAKMIDFETVRQQLANGTLLNLNTVDNSKTLLPYLVVYPDPNDRAFAARTIYNYFSGAEAGSAEPRRLQNVGELGSIRITRQTIEGNQGLQEFRHRLQELDKQVTGTDPASSILLLTPTQLQFLKRSMVVRTPDEYSKSFWLYLFGFLASFFLVHLVWHVRRYQGDTLLLPMIALLCGVGFMVMMSLRDPLRDKALFVDFAQGVIMGCFLMLAVSFIDFQKSRLRKLSYVPLLLSFALSLALILFGTGPGISDVKVNLKLGPFNFQPVETIKILLVLFLAGYFASRWEFLRALKEERSNVPAILQDLDLPRLRYALPVVIGMGTALLFFFLQRDLGPALIISVLFLALYGTARERIGAVVVGILIMIGGFWFAYALGFPKTVSGRIGLWLSPWNNYVRPGGDHLAHSFWALGSGSTFGMGMGLGEPGLIPAVHTDLVLPAIGEELGFFGLLGIFIIYAILIRRAFRISLSANGDYGLWLGLGLTLLTAFQILFISGGVLGLIPFSGVVTPFLSYGRSSMIANFILLGVLMSISARPGEGDQNRPFEKSSLWLTGIIFVILGLVVLKIGYTQILKPDATMAAGALIVQSDGVRRFEYNPRLIEAARLIPRGTVYDRNNVPLATSRWDELEHHRKQYQQLGINLDQVVYRTDNRHYPFGALTFHILGDWRSKLNWAARNTSFVERDSNPRLQGYDDHARIMSVKDARTGKFTYIIKRDYRELIPLFRYRFWPSHEKVKNILNRNRDVHLSVDIQLQRRMAQIMESHIRQATSTRGAAIVFDVKTGDLLASVTYPWMEAVQRSFYGVETDVTTERTSEALLDRARYGVYPPGSSFKLVTAIAALRRKETAAYEKFSCIRLGDGRVGNYVRGWRRPVRDDIMDKWNHGSVDLTRGLIVSCNAYFAQLGTYVVGADELMRTASLFNISAATPNTAEELKKFLPPSSYGQGEVVASPMQMARVAGTIANDGSIPSIGSVQEERSTRMKPQSVLAVGQARFIAQAMRGVVTSGTGRSLAGASVPVAGKTGTAELENAPSHAWFAGFAPYGSNIKRQIAFAVLIEHGTYGGRAAAPAAGEIIQAALSLGLIKAGDQASPAPEGEPMAASRPDRAKPVENSTPERINPANNVPPERAKPEPRGEKPPPGEPPLG